jgi:hypothetical protein
MSILILLAALALAAIVATAVELRRDGFRRIPTDPTRIAPSTRAATASRTARPVHRSARAHRPLGASSAQHAR